MASALVSELFAHPLHPDTKGLIGALPQLGRQPERPEAIEGTVPDVDQMPKCCHFSPRCKYATERCREEYPELKTMQNGRQVRCFYAEEEL